MSHSKLLLIAALAVSASGFAQSSKSAPNVPKAKPAITVGTPHIDLEDGDSADIPPFAKGKIDEETYLKMRDEQIAKWRGLPDLAKAPQARQNAVQHLERGENTVSQRAAFAAAMTKNSSIQTAIQPTWKELGPAPIPNGQTDPNFQPQNELPVSGRVTAIAVDPQNSSLVYVGTAQGGVYRTSNGGQSWTPLMDSARSLAIGAIAIDPKDTGTIFIGTGEANLSLDSFFGVGLYVIRGAKSGHGQLFGPYNQDGNGHDIFTGRSISSIVVDPRNDNNLLVGSSSGVSGMSGDVLPVRPTRGVYLTTNIRSANPTFTREQIPPTGSNFLVADMTVDPANPTRVVVALGNSGGVWTSTAGDPFNNTATWSLSLNVGFNQAKLALVHPGGANTTSFILTTDNSIRCTPVGGTARTVAGVMFKSVNAGQSWGLLPAASGFCGGQCFYDQAPAVDPSNPLHILVGGAAGRPTAACSARIMSASNDGGLTFQPSSDFLHADSHATVFAPSDPTIVYAGNDGGIFKSIDGGKTWGSINTLGFSATQFESLPVHPQLANFTIGGTQDNGTELRNAAGKWRRADFGDGGFSQIDSNSTTQSDTLMYHTYFNQTNNLLGYAVVYGTDNAVEGNWGFSGCGNGVPGNNGIICTDSVLFYAPVELGPGTYNPVYYATDRLYRSADFGNNNVPVSPQFQAGNPISAVGIAPQDDNVKTAGLAFNGLVFMTADGGTNWFNVTGPWGNFYIARISIDPSNKNVAYVSLDGYGTANHVWKTTNLTASANGGTTTWTAASSGLPDVPANVVRVDFRNSNYVYVGTDIGVFYSADGGNTWQPYGVGLPRVAVFDLHVVPATGAVRVGTHGRGAWEVPSLF